ncbi:MAG: peptidase [Zetaproteobacteria bacterium CG12_big_fil_rev_8_21_14_0_65_55_1124]|nr:MAG: peptidase [Zetaproteobacteria bacterium CG1_02_55_237]PIS19182.1 MAG: peptidase [Zetaproteobacteria bacterium CG08_land_8_20_14_0_20_55_17]PIW43877.1 MAG: peptidase [Zetaproteobacteria bacterium CG12_big_fil_rev_8_21_14_0_65_55_1124]PIY53023.1 MAG: peptidase [Zetaproteobacteria bacterium CG_4_10_14_0_8_um_filter_55_43]PIZ37657.1 MAG: peptidase [Zetaproteobacteria bacterium CG_4_10_14_0_2_um_filter_55_20]PJB79708.1 MAG: peptidase [Zetaproteobacteria bacterium CG_4_9_14_0_8_um_filter_55_
MTYCVAINTDTGFVVCSDSRTNASFDDVSVYRKMHTFVWPGNRVFALLSAGNLATTQLVTKRLNADLDNKVAINLFTVKTMQEAADYVAAVNMSVQNVHVVRDAGNTSFEATFILAGQIGNARHETLMIYPQGNYIHESDEHPYLQIGETKYGKPILDRVVSRKTFLERAGRCALVSMNSTIRSNLTVGPPIDLLIYEKDSLNFTRQLYLTEDDPFSRQVADAWNEGLIMALQNLPKFYWENPAGKSADPVANSGSSSY